MIESTERLTREIGAQARVRVASRFDVEDFPFESDLSVMSLYQRIPGASFEFLDPILQRIHDVRKTKRYSGRCDIECDHTLRAWLLAKIAGLPSRGSNVAVKVTMNCGNEAEEWIREFGSHRLRSVLRLHDGRLRERLGLAEFTFDLQASADRIDWHLMNAKLWPIPIPITWLIECSAAEAVVDGRYTFEVKAQVRGIGMIVHYRGWLAEA